MVKGYLKTPGTGGLSPQGPAGVHPQPTSVYAPVVQGSGPPTPGGGANSQFYIDTSVSPALLYINANGTWVLVANPTFSVPGSPGEDGQEGPPGPPGPTGPAGTPAPVPVALAVVQSRSSTFSVNGGPSQVTLASTPTHNNLLLAIVAQAQVNGAPSASTGWTLASFFTASGTPNGVYFAVYYKYAGTSESATQQPQVAGLSYAGMTLWEISGVTGTFATDEVNILYNNNTGSPSLSFTDVGYTTIGSGSLVLAMIVGNNTISYATPTIMVQAGSGTLTADDHVGAAGGLDGSSIVAGHYTLVPAAGTSLKESTSTTNLSHWGSIYVELKSTGGSGPVGPIGPTGPTGPGGPVGAMGLDGWDGEDGQSIPGPAGVTGATGVAGPIGPSGLDGRDGEDGAPGLAGVAGAAGPAGATGLIGPPGQDGNSGEDYSGPPGGVYSVFGRTGPVTAAIGDYTAAQVTNAADVTANNVFTGATQTIDNTGSGAVQVALLLASNLQSAVQPQSYSNTASNASQITFDKARGTEASPLAVNTLDTLGFFNTRAYTGTRFRACGRFQYNMIDPSPSDTALGSQITIALCKNSSITLSTAFSIDWTSGLQLFGTTTVNPSGAVVGLIASPYSQQTPVTGFSITVGNAVNSLILTPAGTLATGTVKMPASPQDGHEVSLASSQTVTALTVSPNTGQTLLGAITTIAANGFARWKYVLATTTWYRVG